MDLATAFGIIGMVPIVVYGIHMAFFSPRHWFRLKGEQGGEPIEIEKKGLFYFGVTTNSPKTVLLNKIAVRHNPKDVSLEASGDGKVVIGLDEKFPLELIFSTPRSVKLNHFQVYGFKYEAKSKSFEIVIDSKASISRDEIPPVIDMLSPREKNATRVAKFRVVEKLVYNLKKHGFIHKPHEHIHFESELAKDEWWAVADAPNIPLQVIEVLEDSPNKLN